MTKYLSFSTLLYALLSAIIANSFIAVRHQAWLIAVILPVFVLINIFAGAKTVKTQYRNITMCRHGGVLLVVFLLSTAVSIALSKSIRLVKSV